MIVADRKDIKAHLDRALDIQSVVLCILHEGIAEIEHSYRENSIIHTKIEFQPYSCIDDYYVGLMFYPNGKSQGLMNFRIASFLSVVCLEEA
jgi:hypothetical protein